MQKIDFSIIFFVLTGSGFAVTALITGLMLVVKTQLLYFHLKKTNYKRWIDLTTLDAFGGKIGPGASNPFKLFAYLKSGLDNEDEVALRCKNSLRITLRYMGIFIVAASLTLVSALVLALYQN